jgi:hypothetical protein
VWLTSVYLCKVFYNAGTDCTTQRKACDATRIHCTPRQAAIALGAEPFYPKQYERSGPKLWPLKNEKLKIEN